jgi:hypothetical protein
MTIYISQNTSVSFAIFATRQSKNRGAHEYFFIVSGKSSQVPKMAGKDLLRCLVMAVALAIS